jgi:hypothetical protein
MPAGQGLAFPVALAGGAGVLALGAVVVVVLGVVAEVVVVELVDAVPLLGAMPVEG